MSHYVSGYEWRIYELVPVGSTVLDVGFGYGLWGYQLKVRRIAKKITGVEPYKPYCDLVGSFNVYDHILNKNVFDLSAGGFDYDVVLCCDVIEHVDRADVDSFIDRLESWGRKIIIATPNGDMKNDKEQDGNSLNRHRTFFKRQFFEDRAFKTEIVKYYPDSPKIFRPLIRLYNLIRGNRGITSCIIAVKG